MKKTLALLLVVFTLIAQLSMVTVSADGAIVTVESVTAAAGETVDVNVDLANCAGFSNLMLEFDYVEGLTFLGATNGIDNLSPTMSEFVTDKPYVVMWESNNNKVYSGTILTLQFKVDDNAVSGTTYPVTVSYGKGPNGDFEDGYDCNYDENFVDLELSYVNGGITIPAPVVPDVPSTPAKPEIPEFVAPSGAYVKVEDYAEWANPGDTVDIKVDLANCAGFSNLMLEFDYDDGLEFIGATNGIDNLSPTMSEFVTDKPYVIMWESNNNKVYSGTIVTLQFKLADNAEPGKYNVYVSYGKGPNGDFEDGYDCNYDEDFVDLELSYFNGSVQVKGADTPVVPDEPAKPEIPEFVAPSGAYIKVEDYAEWANPGDIVDIKVDLANCAGFSNLMLEFDYDEGLEFIGATNGIDNLSPTMSEFVTDKPYVIMWESNNNKVYSGTIVTLQFKVNDNAVGGKYNVTVSYGKGPNGDFEDGYDCNYDEDFVDLELSYFNGSIQVKGGNTPVVPTEYALDAEIAPTTNLGVNITAEGPAMEGKIIAALYNGKDLAQVKIFDAAADLTATFTKSGDKIKVMWWDGMLTAKPLCYSVELPL